MNAARLRSAAAGRLQQVRDGDDAGFMLVYVLAITAIVTVLVASTLVVSASSIVPSVQASYSQAADAAAQGGLQAFVAYADQQCAAASSSVTTCTLPTNYSGIVKIPIPNGSPSYSASYSWVAAKDPSNRYFRVKSTGKVVQGGVSSTKVVVGDIVGGASLDILDYGVVTGFEGQSSASVLSDWPQRTIAFDAAGANAADVPIKGNSIRWSGASPGTAAGKVAVCNATFDDKGGRSTNTPPKASTPYVDWTESGLAGNNYTHFAPCQTSWGTLTKLLQPDNPANGAGGYFSNDALLLSNSYPGGTGPLFNQPVSTKWHYTSADAGICGTSAGQNYRSFNLLCAGYPVEVGGSPSPSSLYPTVQWGTGPQIPSSAPTIAANACEYTGPTRVVLNGSTATVTSPQTTSAWISANAAARPPQCYTGAGATGMAAQTVNLTTPVSITNVVVDNDGSVPKTTPAIAHGSSGWNTTGQKLGDTAGTSNSVFYLTNGTPGTTSAAPTYTDLAAPGAYVPAVNDNPSTKPDGAWKPAWTSYSSGSSCGTATSPTDLKFANCYLPKGTYADAYSWVKAGVQAALAANPSAYTTAAQLQALVDSFTKQGNSADASSSPTSADSTSHRWVVSTSTTGSANGCTTATGVQGTATDTGIAAPSSDAFYANTPGTSHAVPSTDTSCLTVTVSLQVGTCNVALVLGACVNLGNYVWGNGTALLGGGQSIPQFQVTETVRKTTVSTTVTPATSTFPSMQDVTQYQLGNSGTFGTSGPGDLYVEGSADHTMALVAAGDLIVTGAVKPTDQNTAALELIGRNNVRIYHPVKCRVTDATLIANTDPGFCPDDLTGLYTSVLPSPYRPDQQYVNLRSDLKDLLLQAAVFALGNADAHINCPQPPNGGGVCGGEFSVDNYERGAGLGQLKSVGTLAMSHHAAVGQEWETTDVAPSCSSNTTDAPCRPYSGYQMTQKYLNVKALIAASPDVSGVLHTTSTTSSLWHILSISAGSGS